MEGPRPEGLATFPEVCLPGESHPIVLSGSVAERCLPICIALGGGYDALPLLHLVLLGQAP